MQEPGTKALDASGSSVESTCVSYSLTANLWEMYAKLCQEITSLVSSCDTETMSAVTQRNAI